MKTLNYRLGTLLHALRGCTKRECYEGEAGMMICTRCGLGWRYRW